MAWEHRRNRKYYYQSQRVNGRVRRRYLGGSREAERRDFEVREARLLRQRLRDQEANHAEVIEPLVQLCRLTDLLLAGHLRDAGYHQPSRTWRKKRHGDAKPATDR